MNHSRHWRVSCLWSWTLVRKRLAFHRRQGTRYFVNRTRVLHFVSSSMILIVMCLTLSVLHHVMREKRGACFENGMKFRTRDIKKENAKRERKDFLACEKIFLSSCVWDFTCENFCARFRVEISCARISLRVCVRIFLGKSGNSQKPEKVQKRVLYFWFCDGCDEKKAQIPEIPFSRFRAFSCHFSRTLFVPLFCTFSCHFSRTHFRAFSRIFRKFRKFPVFRVSRARAFSAIHIVPPSLGARLGSGTKGARWYNN